MLLINIIISPFFNRKIFSISPYYSTILSGARCLTFRFRGNEQDFLRANVELRCWAAAGTGTSVLTRGTGHFRTWEEWVRARELAALSWHMVPHWLSADRQFTGALKLCEMQPNVSISQTELATQWPHRTQASSIPHQTLLPVDPFSPGFLLVSRSAFSPLLTSPAALSSYSHTGIVGISSPSSAKAWGNPSQDSFTISGKTKEICPHCTQGCPMAQRSVPALCHLFSCSQ